MPLLILLRVLLLAAGLAVCRGYPTAGAGDARAYNSSMCQRSFACGGHNIHYPFYLSNESKVVDGVAYSYCGYPGMAVLCDDSPANSTATIQLAGGTNYTVLGIDYDNHTISLADADADVLKGGDGGCPRPRHNVTIPREAWLNFTPTGNTTISFFLDCSITAPLPLEIVAINCTGFDRGRGSFLAPQLGALDFDPSAACKEVYVAPVQTGEWLTSPEYRPRLGDGGYGDVLRRGFRLSWDPSAGPCFRCELSGGRCSYDQPGGFLGCLCSDGRVRNTDCDGQIL